ncbi:MAG: nitroreductase [Thiopseudomonas sp.]
MTEALSLLLERTSCPRLQQPAPDAAQLDLMFRAALRAPDHAQLHPWRFLVIEGQGLQALGELYASALLHGTPDATAEQLKRARSMPLRAPMIVVLIARLQSHPKVPEYEQLIAAGCAGHGILLAAQAMGLGAFWRSGEFCEHDQVAAGLGLQAGERLIGFMYLGTPCQPVKAGTGLEPANFVTRWPLGH